MDQEGCLHLPDASEVSMSASQCSAALQEIMNKTRIKETYKLTGVSHGEIDLELRWLSIMQVLS